MGILVIYPQDLMRPLKKFVDLFLIEFFPFDVTIDVVFATLKA